MGNCRKFRGLLLADYADAELDSRTLKELQEHLAACDSCREFSQKVKNDLINPLRQAPQEPVPDSLWASIKEKIAAEEEALERGNLKELFAGLKSYLFSPRLVPVIASFIAAIFIASMALHSYQIKQSREIEQGEYLLNVFELSVPSADAQNGSGIESLIEDYFL